MNFPKPIQLREVGAKPTFGNRCLYVYCLTSRIIVLRLVCLNRSCLQLHYTRHGNRVSLTIYGLFVCTCCSTLEVHVTFMSYHRILNTSYLKESLSQCLVLRACRRKLSNTCQIILLYSKTYTSNYLALK